MTIAFMSFGLGEMLVVAVIALLVFGGNLPDVMRTLGRTYARFRGAMHEFSRPVRDEMRQLTRLPNEAPVPHDPPSADLPPDQADARLRGEDEADDEHAAANPWISEAAQDIGTPDEEVDEPPPA